jgi:probable phosphoglycerate mutase
MKRFLLARHGETTWNRDGRIQGWADISLNDRGREQAATLGEFLVTAYPGLEAIHASDLDRAVETVEILQDFERLSTIPVTFESRWRERDFGIYQGQDSETFFDEHPKFAVLERGQEAAAAVPEAGESYLAFRERVLRAWEDLRASEHDEVLLVAHAGVLRTVLGAVLDLSLREALDELEHTNAGVAEVEYDCGTGEARVVHRDRVDHLRPPA